MMAVDWVQTLQGKKLTPRALRPDQVGSVEEIAHSLAGNFRFTRQTRARESVAEHCVRGARLLPAAFAGAFLLHELSEVYLPDVNAPMKPTVYVDVIDCDLAFFDPKKLIHTVGDTHLMVPWTEIERQHTHVMLEALGLLSIESLIYSPEVREMDLAMLAAEKRDLCGPEPESWNLKVEPAATGPIVTWSPEFAAGEFLLEYTRLFSR